MLDEHLHHQQKTHPLWPGLLSAVVKQELPAWKKKFSLSGEEKEASSTKREYFNFTVSHRIK